MKVKGMKVNKKLLVIATLFLSLNMIMATQYAVTKIGYEFNIVHPSDANIRYIGSDNSSGGRLLRVAGTNGTGSLKLTFGDWSAGTNKMYSAAFGIVNEEQVPVDIMYIDVSSDNSTYLKIWLHGNRSANANSTDNDPTTVLMYDNGSIINDYNVSAWTLAQGNGDADDMCSDISDRGTYSSNTTWDETQQVRYSLNDSIGYGVGIDGKTADNASDFVWIQVAIDIPNDVDGSGLHTGNIEVHFKADTT